MVLNIIDHFEIRRNEPPHGGKRLAERPHIDVDGVLQPKVFARAPALFTEYANRMRIIHHQHRVIRLAQFGNLRQLGNAPLHAEHPINDDHLALVRPQAMQDPLEVLHVVVAKFERFPE